MGNCKGNNIVQPVSLLDTLDDSLNRGEAGEFRPRQEIIPTGNTVANPDDNHIDDDPPSSNETMRTNQALSVVEAIEPSSSDESNIVDENAMAATQRQNPGMDITTDSSNESVLEEFAETLEVEEKETMPKSKSSDENA